MEDLKENFNLYKTARLILPNDCNASLTENDNSKITNIENETNCSIILLDSQTKDKNIFIYSNLEDQSNEDFSDLEKELPFEEKDEENLNNIVKSILELAKLSRDSVFEYYDNREGDKPGDSLHPQQNPREGGGEPDDEFVVETKLLMHNYVAGKVFGLKGLNIKRLTSYYQPKGCRIEMRRTLCPKSDDRILTVNGHIVFVEEILRDILKTIRRCNVSKIEKGIRDIYDANEAFDDDYGTYCFTGKKSSDRKRGMDRDRNIHKYRSDEGRNARDRDRGDRYDREDRKRARNDDRTPFRSDRDAPRDRNERYMEKSKYERQNPECVCLRLLIQNSTGGKVIGRRAERVKNLRSRHNMKIDVSDTDSEDRILQLLSHERDSVRANTNTVLDCLEDILDEVGDEFRKAALAKHGYLYKGGMDRGKNSNENTEIRILVNGNTMGRVIGAKACNIKELRSHCHMVQAYSNTCPGSNDRVLAMSGNIDEIIKATKLVLGHIKDAENREEGPRYTCKLQPGFPYNTTDYGGFLPQCDPFYFTPTSGPKGQPLSGNAHMPPSGPPMMGHPPPAQVMYSYPPPGAPVQAPPAAYNNVMYSQPHTAPPNMPYQAAGGNNIMAQGQMHMTSGAASHFRAAPAHPTAYQPIGAYQPMGTVYPAHPAADASSGSDAIAKAMGLDADMLKALKEQILAESKK